MPTHDPDGATTYAYGSKVAMKCRASAAASFVSPLLKAGCPQQVCAVGTSTVQPASLSSFNAAKPMRGRIASTRQVTNRATRGEADGGMAGRRRGTGDGRGFGECPA